MVIVSTLIIESILLVQVLKKTYPSSFYALQIYFIVALVTVGAAAQVEGSKRMGVGEEFICASLRVTYSYYIHSYYSGWCYAQ